MKQTTKHSIIEPNQSLDQNEFMQDSNWAEHLFLRFIWLLYSVFSPFNLL